MAWGALLARDNRAFPPTRVHAASEVGNERVLVLAPHPDDEVIGLGGTLAAYRDRGARPTVVYMTDGAGVGETRAALSEVRRREATSVSKRLGFDPSFWDRADTALTNDDPTVSELENLLAQLEPDVVYVPAFFEHHFDHFTTSQILCDAMERRPEWRGEVAAYEVWECLPFPNRVHVITDRMEEKVAMMELYGTPQEATDFAKLFRYRNHVHYLLHVDSRRQESEGYAEAFVRLPAADYRSLHESFRAVQAERGGRLHTHLSS